MKYFRFSAFFFILLVNFFMAIKVLAQDAEQTYRVKKGDTLSEIAARFNLSQEQLIKANPQIDPDLLMVGEELQIPPADSISYNRYLQNRYNEYLAIQPVDCYPNPHQTAECLTQIKNIGDRTTYNIRLIAQTTDSEGGIRESVSSPIVNQVLPGESIPVLFRFDNRLSDTDTVQCTIDSLELSKDTSLSLRLDESQWSKEIVFSSDKKSAKVILHFEQAAMEKTKSILIAAYNEDGKVVGIRGKTNSVEQDLSLFVYSLSGMIQDISVWVEAY